LLDGCQGIVRTCEGGFGGWRLGGSGKRWRKNCYGIGSRLLAAWQRGSSRSESWPWGRSLWGVAPIPDRAEAGSHGRQRMPRNAERGSGRALAWVDHRELIRQISRTPWRSSLRTWRTIGGYDGFRRAATSLLRSALDQRPGGGPTSALARGRNRKVGVWATSTVSGRVWSRRATTATRGDRAACGW